MKPLILIGTPCYGGVVFQGYMESVLRLMVYASQNDFEVSLALLGGDSLITRSRNKLVSAFLDMPQATHLMFIDADISFLPEDIHRMLKLGQDVVAGVYPIKNYDWDQARKKMKPEMDSRDLAESGLHFVGLPCPLKEREVSGDFVTGVYAGTGFMLIARAALKRMIKAYPETKYDVAHVYPMPAHASDHQYALFDCMIEPGTQIYLSEDFTFCRRWRDIGGQIWLDTKSRLAHDGTFRFQGRPTIATISLT
ncbi:MAG: hypothetical protein PHS57_07470 [Alphaproteobacteria bacterium]|nr:hypothetical protein [Alphaproteobacteria bacterium]